MKNKLLVAVLLTSLFSCQSPKAEAEHQETSIATAPAIPVAQATEREENAEYLDWLSLRINGKFPLTTTIKNIDGLLGKPDSVNILNWNETCSAYFRSEDSKAAYYGGLQFDQFGDSLEFLSVDFSKNQDLFLQHNDLKLNASTALDKIKVLFPVAAKQIDKMNEYEVGEVDIITLPPSKALADGQWLLMFQKGKLLKIQFWIPC